jgi:hypothetical protein
LYSLIGCPFDIFALQYLAGTSVELNAGPNGGHPHAHIAGAAGHPYDLPNPHCHSDASLAYDFLYTYYKNGASGWKSYELGIKITVDFGYVEQTKETERNVLVTTQSFEQRWISYVYWNPS